MKVGPPSLRDGEQFRHEMERLEVQLPHPGACPQGAFSAFTRALLPRRMVLCGRRPGCRAFTRKLRLPSHVQTVGSGAARWDGRALLW